MEPEFTNIYSTKEEERLKEEFPLLHGKPASHTYLDNAGAGLYSQSQMAAIHKDLTSHLFSNPHTHFGESVQGEDDVNARVHEARQLVLRFFNTDSSRYQVIFTSNATASMRLVAENFPWHSSSHFAYLAECHTSAVGLRQYAAKEKAECHVLTDKDFEDQISGTVSTSGTKLVVFPAMSNFCGKKYPIRRWTEVAHEHDWHVLLDAAAFVATSPLDLSQISPDFVALSFYKIFGYPTGLGALLVRKESLSILSKNYFGGGTVEMNLIRENRHVGKSGESNFEDGTIPFLSILSLRFGFEVVNWIGMSRISEHTFNLAKYFYQSLKNLKYPNGNPVAKVYNSGSFSDVSIQGGIVNFNLIKSDGKSLFGFSEFQKISLHNNLIVRVGCFCNIGACQKYLGLTDKDVSDNHAAGHVCGDSMDMVNGRPTGSIRVSFGYYSLKADADKVLDIIRKNYIDSSSVETNLIKNGESTESFISGLYLYPVKSCAGMRVQSWPLTKGSLLHDRQFVILQGGSPLTQKSFPGLCLLRPSIDLERNVLTLSCEDFTTSVEVGILDEDKHQDMDRINSESDQNRINSNSDQNRINSFTICTGKVCGDSIEGFDCGADVSNWLEEITGLTGLKLVQLLSRKNRHSVTKNGISNDLQTFANEAQFLIINRASCQALQVETPDPDWLVEQFRGNIIIDGATPFEEEDWKTLEVDQLGSVKFRATSLCTRCTIIGLDQKTGEKVSKDQDPISALTKRSGQRFKFGVLAFLDCNNEDKSARNLSVNMKLKIVKK